MILLRKLLRILLWLLIVISNTCTDIDNLLNAHANTSFKYQFYFRNDTYIKADTNMQNTDTNTYIDTNTNTNIDINTPRQANNHIHMDINMYVNTTTNTHTHTCIC